MALTKSVIPFERIYPFYHVVRSTNSSLFFTKELFARLDSILCKTDPTGLFYCSRDYCESVFNDCNKNSVLEHTITKIDRAIPKLHKLIKYIYKGA